MEHNFFPPLKIRRTGQYEKENCFETNMKQIQSSLMKVFRNDPYFNVLGPHRFQQRYELQKKELRKERTFDNFSFDEKLPLQLIPKVSSILANEPKIMIQIIKSRAPIHFGSNIFYITPRGLLGSLRSIFNSNKDIVIGRKDNGSHRILDIMISQDCLVSRQHCRLLYEFAFPSTNKEDKENYYTFLKFNQKKRGSKLSHKICEIILSFIERKKQLFIGDLGSLYGTYVKTNECELTINNYFLISNRVGICIEGIYESLNSFFALNEKVNEATFFSNVNLGEMNCNYLDFLKQLNPCIRLRIAYGEPSENLMAGEIFLISSSIEFQSEKIFKVDFGPHKLDLYHVNCYIAFEIRYDFLKKKWFIKDVSNVLKGTPYEEKSDFGLWKCISDYKIFGQQRRFIEKIQEIQSGAFVKVSETVFKISWL